MSEGFEAAAWSEPWLARRAASTPDRIALEFGASSLSYGELQREVLVVAAELTARGVAPGDVVATGLGNGVEFPRLLWALRAVGAVLLPLNPRLATDEAAHILRDSGASLWLDAGDSGGDEVARAAGDLPRLVMRGLRLEGGASVVSRPRPAPLCENPWEILALIYTSGTTGKPKGALLSAGAFRASAMGSAALLGTDSDERWLGCMPLFHVGGLSILLRACLAGSAVVVQPGFDAQAVSAALDDLGITGVSLVSTMLGRLLDARGERRAPPGLRRVLLGGGPAPPALLARAHAAGYPLAPTYGLTEAASQVATRLPDDVAPPFDERLSPLPGTEVRVVDAGGRVLDSGEAGEICVRGATLMRGYLGRPEATARALRQGWLQTGDLGVLDDRGRLRVLDRRDDLIVSGGENVYPAEIEAVLNGHPAVREAAVVGQPDAEYGARPMVWWVPLVPGSPAPDLEAYCRGRLAGFKVPRRFVPIAELPRNASGKLLRRELRALAGADTDD